MRPALAVPQQAWTLHFETTKDGSKRQIGVAFARAPTAAIGALPVRCQASSGLALDHDLSDAFGYRLAFGQSEAERFRLQITTLHGCDFSGLLVTVVGKYH